MKPTPEQIAAMKAKVITRGESPYADFSVLTPYGRRVAKQMKTRCMVFHPDGTFKHVDVPGPPSFSAWSACWKVFRACIFMLRHPPPSVGALPKQVATSASLEEYYENIQKLSEEFPEAWHLIMQAEDKCRAEAFERYRRNLTKANMEGKLPMGLSFDPTAPWTSVFIFAARDSDYWSKHVVRPAHSFIARGGRTMSLKNAEDTNLSGDAKEALQHVLGQADSPKGTAVKRETKKEKKARKELEKKRRAEQDGGSVAKKWGTHYITDENGTEICFKFAKGEAGACPDPCPDGRVHVCQHCLGRHPNGLCPTHVKKPPGGKGSGKSSKPGK